MKIIFLGAPGSGKGSLSNVLINQYGFKHISTGDLFRKTISTNGPYANELKSILMSGQLVEDDLTNNIVKNEILELCKKDSDFILDGYPRNLNQAQFLSKIIKIDHVINVKVDDEELIKRITGRRTCPICKAIYNVYYKKPKMEGICDNDGVLLIQRNDDEKSIAQKRLEVFKKQNKPLLDYYKKQNILSNVENINFDKAVSQLKKICNLK